MKWALAIAALLALMVPAGFAMAATPRRKYAVFPADRWGIKPWPSTDFRARRLAAIVEETEPVLEAAGMPVAVAIGQSALETGWYKAGVANPWGIRGSGDAGSDFITTKEVFDPAVGAVTLTDQKFARFSSNAAAARGLVKFLSGPMYREGWALRAADDGLWLLWLWGMGYATSTNYPSAVVATSRRAAVQLERPDLAVTWSPNHQAIADQLAVLPAGSQRRAKTRALLGGMVA
jgi:hypothetical protein